ncbi:hypothetical protein GCM10010129_24480 [Streptomyces fumigatiscleroticus]|nr:hypothetical protein GCM10010129_24480 [Streptomyces fumigatiscleroticus]
MAVVSFLTSLRSVDAKGFPHPGRPVPGPAHGGGADRPLRTNRVLAAGDGQVSTMTATASARMFTELPTVAASIV